MAITYSTNLRLTLIGTGDQAGTWGNTTNTNLGTLIEQAIAGFASQTVSDSAGYPTSLNISDGTSSVARNMIIALDGALSAPRDVILPTNKKLYFVHNNTTGGHAVTVKCAGQTGVVVPAGAKALLACNGTDIIDAANYFSTFIFPSSATITTLSGTTLGYGSASITTLSVTNAINGSVTGNAGTVTNGVYTTGDQTITGNKTFSGAVYMSQSGGGEGGEILWNDPVQGTVCTDIPASGAFRVFQTSGTSKGAYIDLANCAGGVGSLLLHSTNYNSYAPTLTGTGASGTWGISVTGSAGAVDFNNLTNKSSGTGTYTTSGDFRAPIFYDSNNTAYYLDPANSTTSAVFAGGGGFGLTTGMNYADYGRFVVAGGQAGTSTSIIALYTQGSAQGERADIALYSTFEGTGDNAPRRTADILAGFNGGSWGNEYLSFNVGNNGSGNDSRVVTSEKMRILSNGKVGIGTNNPDATLDVNGTFRIANDGGGGYGALWTMRNMSSGATNPNKNFRINSTGTLEIINSAYNAILFSFFDSGSLIAYGDMRAPIFYDANNTAYYLDPSNTGTSLNVAGTIVGNIVGANRLYSGFDDGSTNSMSCSNWFRSSGATGWFNSTHGGGINMEDTTYVRVYGSKKLYVANSIDATGNITAYFSDERLKTKVGAITNALDKVQRLDGFYYVENEKAKELGYSNDDVQVGVSAQQVQEVLPEIIHRAPVDVAVDEFGNMVSKTGENYMTVDYSRLVPLLIEAVKEQQAQINELKLMVHQLKGN